MQIEIDKKVFGILEKVCGRETINEFGVYTYSQKIDVLEDLKILVVGEINGKKVRKIWQYVNTFRTILQR